MLNFNQYLLENNIKVIEYDEIVERTQYLDIGYIAPYYLKTDKFNIIAFNNVKKELRTKLINLLNNEFENIFSEQYIRYNWVGIEIFYVMISPDNNELIGCIALDNKNGFICLSNLYITEENRNKGYGKLLLEYIYMYIKRLGYNNVRLWCKDNLVSYYKGWRKETKIDNNNILIFDI